MKPRTNVHRELFGCVGKGNFSEEMKRWNKAFSEEGRDAVMSRYGTTKQTLPERLSEMFLFDRRGYIVGRELQKAAIPLLDKLDRSVKDRVDTIVNNGGSLEGFFLGNDDSRRAALWKI